MNPKSFRNYIIVLILVIFSFGAGINIGEKKSVSLGGLNTTFSNTAPPIGQNIDFSLFWDVWKRLNNNYIDKKALDSQKMFYGAISGMVSALGDPYTVFLPPTQNKDSKDSLGGRFEGIGAQLGVKDKKIIIVAPLKGTPADLAGLKAGDWIIKVDGKDTASWTLPETVTAIRGPKGTKVKLSIVHPDSQKAVDVSVVRDTINVPSVEWSLKPSGNFKVAYLKLSQFGDQTNNEWNKAVGEIESNIATDSAGQIKGLVLDLRNNPGGYLSGAVYIGSEFLKDGTVVMEENADGTKNSFDVNRQGRLLSIPLVVLVNKGSASASEIVSGALQDRRRAKLVGEVTFGKGTIQDVQDLANGAGLHITVAKWLLPSGRWVNGTGVTPDVVVANDDKKPDEDVQLNKAMEMLNK